MAKAVSLVNTNTRDLDVAVDTTGTSRYKRALNARAVAGLDHSIADQAVATGQDDAAFTPGTDGVVAAGFTLDDTATDLVDEGDLGAARMTARRLLLAVLADPTTDSQRLGITSRSAAQVEGVASGTPVAIVGDVAHDAVDSGKPVKIGGKATSGAPTAVATGDRVDAWFNPLGALQVAGFAAGSDAQSGGGTNITNEAGSGHAPLNVIPYVWNGATTDRVRANQDATVLASAARTGTTQSADQTNHNGRGLHLVIDVTAITAAPSITFTIQGKDALSGKYYTILASVAITAIGTTVLRVYPGLTAAANVTANDIVPRTWRVNAVHGNADSITYSVGASIIL